MQTSCCEATLACFSGNQDCVDLRTCLLACPDDPGGVVVPIGGGGDGGGGGGTGDGGGGGTGDGGGGGGGATSSCRGDCAAAHPAAIAAENTYDGCIKASCSTVCR